VDKILLTGATGFIGQAISSFIKKPSVLCAVRSFQKIALIPELEFVVVGKINSKTNWSSILKGVNVVIHCAARAHVVHEKEAKPFEAYRAVNLEGTRHLAEQALRAGVKRFLFLSSIGAVAATSKNPLRANAACFPASPYGCSKLEAEKALQKISLDTKMQYTIIRPPLVYGPKNPANMATLFKIVDTGIPLPLSALSANQRSFVSVSNLVDLIMVCLEHPAAANQTFHVSDDDDISTAELLRRMGRALGKPVRNLPIPQTILKTGLRVLRKGEWIDKLFGDLRVDISETKRLLGWKPKVTMEEELERTAVWWKTRKK